MGELMLMARCKHCSSIIGRVEIPATARPPLIRWKHLVNDDFGCPAWPWKRDCFPDSADSVTRRGSLMHKDTYD